MPPDVIAVPLRPRPEAWMTGQLRGHVDLDPFPTGLAPESLVLYTQALDIRKGYLQIYPQRRDLFHHQFRCQARSERETFPPLLEPKGYGHTRTHVQVTVKVPVEATVKVAMKVTDIGRWAGGSASLDVACGWPRPGGNASHGPLSLIPEPNQSQV